MQSLKRKLCQVPGNLKMIYDCVIKILDHPGFLVMDLSDISCMGEAESVSFSRSARRPVRELGGDSLVAPDSWMSLCFPEDS